ncbi:MAG: hypothetical protein Fur009_6710 [Candidatus Microgenomates bacterium]
MTKKLILIILLFINSLLLTFNYPIYFKKNIANISIYPLDKKNPQSKDKEIWINLIEVDKKKINLKKFRNLDWEYKNNSLVNYKNNHQLKIKINYSTSYNICFLKHPYSGFVKLNINNRESAEFDLYNETFSLSCISKTLYPKGISFPSQISTFIYSFFIYLFVHLILVRIVFIITKYKTFFSRQKKFFNNQIFSIFFLVFIFTLLLIFLLSYWPGIYSIDSFDQINQAKSFLIRDNHPALLTFFYAIILNLFHKKESLIIFQLLFISFVLQIFFNFVFKSNFDRTKKILLSLFFLLNPINIFMSITLWKDLPYSFALLGLLITIFNYFYLKNKSKKIIILIYLFSFIILFSRHNGILTYTIFSFFLIIYLFFTNIEEFKFYLKTFLLIILIFTFTKTYIYPKIMKVEKIFSYSNSKLNPFFFFNTHIYYFSKNDIENLTKSSKFYHYFNEIYPIEKLKNIQGYPYYADILFREKELKIDKLLSDTQPIIFFKELILKNPKNFIKNLLKNYSLIWKVEPYPDSYTYVSTDELQFLTKKTCNTYSSNDYCNFITDSKIPIIKKILDKIAVELKTNFIILWRPALYLILINFLALITILDTKNIFFIFPLILVYANLIPYFLILLPQDFRYFYTNTLIFYFYFYILFILFYLKRKNH